ncbi:MAG TPA: hypothetical protein VHM66_01365, partial [Solirubrobacterales bacterium]|nr:hypothetical protein [Solirubrobacterales bacterium]
MRRVGPLLETKLFVPRRRHGVVPRSRLSEQLDRGAQSKLTLISAPAGFGKTTLLAEWLAASADQRSATWLSLDAGDNDPASFWTYVIAALQTAAPGVGEGSRMLLGSDQAPIEGVLTALLNELSTVPRDVVLVLDDYHAIEASKIHAGMAFLLEHLPPQIHVLITTRADPALPLARLRAQGELVEIRAGDLRFTPDEVATYLNQAMGLGLAAQDIATLEGRTEGWIAALQLAALSMQGRDDIAGFVGGFAGDDRYIVDYLVEEVLLRQPEQLRRFLLKTSILNRMSGALCDAVTGEGGGRATLESLDRGNMFVVPLDDRRRWYRYHHLFGEVLRAILMDERRDEVSRLHGRASEWYEQHGERSEAIRHAMAGEDFGRAADLIEVAIPEMRKAFRDTALRAWFKALPNELFNVRPVLAAGYIAILIASAELEGVEELLQSVERWLEMPGDARDEPDAASAGLVVIDEEQFRRLPSAIAMYRAVQARIVGDVAGTIAHAQRSLDLVGGDDDLGRGAAASLLALAYSTRGDLDGADRWWVEGLAGMEKAGYPSAVIGGSIAVA